MSSNGRAEFQVPVSKALSDFGVMLQKVFFGLHHIIAMTNIRSDWYYYFCIEFKES